MKRILVFVLFLALLFFVIIVAWLIAVNYRDEMIREVFWKTGIVSILVTIIFVIYKFFTLSSERIYENALEIIIGTFLVGLVATGVSVIFQIWSPMPNDKLSANVLILKTQDNNINVREFSNKLDRIGSVHKNGYLNLNLVDTFFKKQDIQKSKTDLVGRDVVSLIEMSFWRKLSQDYSLCWQNNPECYEGMGGGACVYYPVDNPEREQLILTNKQISDLLTDNKYEVDLSIKQVALPSKTIVERTVDTNGRVVVRFKNKYFDLIVRFYQLGVNNIAYDFLSDYIKKSLPTASSVSVVKVDFECNYTKYLRGSKKMEDRQKWVKNIINSFQNDYEWSLVRPDLERAYSIDVGK